MKRNSKIIFILLSVVAFLLSRWFILKHPPPYYSDVDHYYQCYANMWRYGLPPYFKHLYEYPPATIPIVYFPLVVDQAGIGQYYQNYRYQAFVFEIFLFTAILTALIYLNTKFITKLLSIGFYLTAGVLAKDFWYEGLDLIFFGILSISFIWLLINQAKPWLSQLIFWVLFWLTTSIKFITLPLLIPFYFLFNRLPQKLSQFKLRSFKPVIAGFLIIWLIPILIFRSSLSVMFIYNLHRPLKFGTFSSYLIELINDFTKTEYRIDQPPDFQMAGPVSDIVLLASKIIYPLTLLIVLIYGISIIVKKRLNQTQSYTAAIKITLIYVFATFLTSKTFSSPFHLWYVPLITLYPFKSTKKQLLFLFLAFWMLVLDTTPYINAPDVTLFGPVKLTRLRDLTRFLPMMILLWQSFQLSFKNRKTKT